ncbi:hypothetical protein MKZ38_002880 [Zalerion maritima]|uniref:Uncharacterized protein n=1 Tax=Zalerion maritima TaxID=339359 RepID=A0AAD5RYJ9_9PEZI|nr:hypothetical protein MKZ38_002880 [Zalerion maritima]
MKLSTSSLVFFSLLPSFGLALPKPQAQSSSQSTSTATSSAAGDATATGGGGDMPAGYDPSGAQIMNAVMSWMNDTGKVSKFLNSATSFSGTDFTREATIALNSEKDELNHKQVLDDAIGMMDQVQMANAVLDTQGSFQMVVDVLQAMVDNGPDTVQADVNAINENRCVNVLPNIDMYFAAAGQSTMSAVRPTGCLEITAAATDGSMITPSTSAGANATTTAAAADATSTTSSTAAAGDTSSTSTSAAADGGDATTASSTSSSTTAAAGGDDATTSSSSATAAGDATSTTAAADDDSSTTSSSTSTAANAASTNKANNKASDEEKSMESMKRWIQAVRNVVWAV